MQSEAAIDVIWVLEGLAEPTSYSEPWKSQAETLYEALKAQVEREPALSRDVARCRNAGDALTASRPSRGLYSALAVVSGLAGALRQAAPPRPALLGERLEYERLACV